MQDDSFDQDRQLRQTRDADNARQAEQRRLDEERERLRLEEENEELQRSRSSASRTSRQLPLESAVADGTGASSRFGRSAAAPSAPATGTGASDAPGRVKTGPSRLTMLALVIVIVAAGAGSWLAFSDRGNALRHQFTGSQPQQPDREVSSALEAEDAPRAEPALPQVVEDQSLLTQPTAPSVLGASPALAPAAEAAPVTAPEPAPVVAATADPVIADKAASGTPAVEVEQRLQSIETMLADIQAQLGRVESARAAALSARPAAPRPQRATAASVSAKPKAVPAVVAEPPLPKMAGQLLAVDVWGGAPSVVVGTGDPGDRRIRVLRPGDTHNGVSLLRADPTTGQATFGVGTATFTMAVKDGG